MYYNYFEGFVGGIQRDQRELNKEYKKTPSTKEQQMIAEKYKNIPMDVRFTKDGKSHSVRYGVNINNKDEHKSKMFENVLMIRFFLTDKYVILTKHPKNIAQKIFKNRFKCFVDCPLFFIEKPKYKNDLFPYFIDKGGQLKQLTYEPDHYDPIELFLDWDDDAILTKTDEHGYIKSEPISFKQQKIKKEGLSVFGSLGFNKKGDKSFIMTQENNIFEVFEKNEVDIDVLDTGNDWESTNGYILIKLGESNPFYKDLASIANHNNQIWSQRIQYMTNPNY